MEKNLLEILLTGKESKELDYKGPFSWNTGDKKSGCEIVKDILAISNTKGGYLVIGVSEINGEFVFEGLTEKQIASFDTTKINQFLNNYADPPVNTTLQSIEYENKRFVIISIPRFIDTPHICQKDYPGILKEAALYVRTDNNESAQIKKSSDFRIIVENAIKNRSDHLLKSFRIILKGGDGFEQRPSDREKFEKQIEFARNRSEQLDPHFDEHFGYRETIFFPQSYNDHLFDLEQLRKISNKASISYTGWPFIFYGENNRSLTYNVEDGIETCVTGPHPFHGGAEFHFWRFFQSGLLYFKELFDEDSYLRVKGDNSLLLDFDRFCQRTGMAIDCLVHLYDGNLPDETEITLIYSLYGIENRSLAALFNTRRLLHRDEHISKVPMLKYMSKKPIAEWKAGLEDHALDICKDVFMRFNWDHPNLHECRKVMEDMFKRKL